MTQMIQMKQYKAGNLVTLSLNQTQILARVLEVHKGASVFCVYNPSSKNFVVINSDASNIIGKLDENQNTDFIPDVRSFDSGHKVTWSIGGEIYYGHVVAQKGHRVTVCNKFGGGLISISSYSLKDYKGDLYTERNSLPEMQGFYVKSFNLKESGLVHSMVIAHEEIRVASVELDESGNVVQFYDVDIQGGSLKFKQLVELWASASGVPSHNAVLFWRDWNENHWIISGTSDRSYAKNLVKAAA